MSSLVCTGAVVTGILQTNGRKAIVGLVASFLLASLSGVTVTPAGTPTVPSTSITFSANQTLPAGFPIVFASQPGTTYYLASQVTASTAGTLTTAYNGPAGATTALGVADASWTSPTLTFGTAQTLPIGFQFQADGTGTVYTLTSPMSAATALPQTSFTPTYVGGNGAASITAVNPANTPVLTIPAVSATDSSPSATVRVVQSNGEATSIAAQPWAVYIASLTSSAVTATPTVDGTAITFSANQTLPAGFPIVFASQPGTTYYLAAAISGVEAAVLTEEFTGPAGASVVSSPGFKVLTSSDLGVFNCVGADRQPVQFVAVAASTLVP
jgi:hypothetical protein